MGESVKRMSIDKEGETEHRIRTMEREPPVRNPFVVAFLNLATNPEARKMPTIRSYDEVGERLDPETRAQKELIDLVDPLKTFAIPRALTIDPVLFFWWFEDRFFSLENDEGIKRFNRRIKDAAEIIHHNPFLVAPGEGRELPLSRPVRDKILKGVTHKEEVRSLLKSATLDQADPRNRLKFLSPDRNSKAGAHRLSLCRVLTIAFLLEKLSVSKQFRHFVEMVGFTLGRRSNPIGNGESGIFAGLQPVDLNRPIAETLDSCSPEQIIHWAEQLEIHPEGANLNLAGFHDRIPELHVGVKGGIRTLLKFLRKEGELKIMKDLFRMRLIFEDEAGQDEILSVAHSLEAEASIREKPLVAVEFKEKNYFSPEDMSTFFPEILAWDEENKPTHRSGVLSKIEIDENEHSGEGYKCLTAVVKYQEEEHLRRPKTIFAFEIQFLRRSELATNEQEETPRAHFPFEFRQLAQVITELNGKQTREEYTEAIADFLERHIKKEKIPKVLVGQEKKKNQKGRKRNFRMSFRGNNSKRAEILFNFLVREGVIIKVPRDFPRTTSTDKRVLATSLYYTHKSTPDRVEEILEAYAKVGNGNGKKKERSNRF